ncbi:MAG: TolC family protein [Pirellulaceae bacterium]
MKRAIKQTQIAAVRNNVAANQILPELNLLFSTYVAALHGDSGIERAWQSQFSSTPGFSAGLSFDMPYRNRAARSQLRRSELEMLQSKAMVEQVTIEITTDAQQAYWRLNSALETLQAAWASLDAAGFELEQNKKRWDAFALIQGDWSEGQTQSLVLDQLLISQQRLFNAQNVVVEAQTELKQAEVFLKRSMGTLMNVSTGEIPPQQFLEPETTTPTSNNVEEPAAPSSLPFEADVNSPNAIDTPQNAAPQFESGEITFEGDFQPASDASFSQSAAQPPQNQFRQDAEPNSILRRAPNELDSAFGGFGWGTGH